MKSLILLCSFLSIMIPFQAWSESVWTKVNFTGGDVSGLVSFPSNPDIMLACVAEHGIFRSVDRGENWSRIITGHCSDISISEDDIAFVAGESGVMVSHNAGETWKTCRDTTAWRVVAFRNGIVAVGTGSFNDFSNTCPSWRLSRDNGVTWESWEGTENTVSLLFHESGVV